jgi:hypothetical protein
VLFGQQRAGQADRCGVVGEDPDVISAAERSLRGPVSRRKLSHGNQSDNDERFTERVLSASVTCRLQHRSLLAYLRELHAAHQTGDALPALI